MWVLKFRGNSLHDRLQKFYNQSRILIDSAILRFIIFSYSFLTKEVDLLGSFPFFKRSTSQAPFWLQEGYAPSLLFDMWGRPLRLRSLLQEVISKAPFWLQEVDLLVSVCSDLQEDLISSFFRYRSCPWAVATWLHMTVTCHGWMW